MPNLTETRKRLVVALAGMGLICVISVVILFSPLVQERPDDINQTRLLEKAKQQQVNRVGDIDQKIASASQQISSFFKDRVPYRDSAISDNLGKIAADSGVRLENVKYTPNDAVPAGLRPIEIDASLSGQYPQLARFLNSVERNQPVFFIVDSIDLGGEQNSVVRLQVKLRTFERPGA